MYEFWYHYVKSKYGEKAKLCYMDTGIVYIKADEFIQTLQKMLKVDLILEVINQIDHYKKKNKKKVIRLLNDKLGRKIMTKLVRLRTKTKYITVVKVKNKTHTKVCHKKKI